MINADQLREYVIKPVLIEYELHSDDAEELIIGTSAVESNCGEYLHQIGGSAIGIYQMEPNTHFDIWNNFLQYKKDLKKKILREFGENDERPGAIKMLYDLRYATLMCRLHYLRVKEALPPCNDVLKIAKYWKKYYNTELGKGTVDKFCFKYDLYIARNGEI